MISEGEPHDGSPVRNLRRAIQWTGLAAGPSAAILLAVFLPDTYSTGDGATASLEAAARATVAVGVWMAIWWMTEAIPVYATSLLPIALLPATGAITVRQATAPYGHELIYLFMGGFILALSMERWGLHRRIAYRALRLVGTRPGAMVAGFMGITAGLSMWVSNTATAIVMLPIATSVIGLVGGASAGSADSPDRASVSARDHRHSSLSLFCWVSPTARRSAGSARSSGRRRTSFSRPTCRTRSTSRSASSAGWESGCRSCSSSCRSRGWLSRSGSIRLRPPTSEGRLHRGRAS